jgi:3-dehydroquinate dehydratase/shikimate dehydrogenase
MMICVVIKGPTLLQAREQIKRARQHADLVELRLDLFSEWDLESLKNLSVPAIFTLRPQDQGGQFKGSEQERLNILKKLATLKPEYLDLEHSVPLSFIHEIKAVHPGVKLILSYHNFTETPKDLDGLYRKMRPIPADFYKIALTPNNPADTLRLILWAKSVSPQLIPISMGIKGQISRILSPFSYASLEDDPDSPLGQLSAQTLAEKYNYRSLKPQTPLFGLIGDPVDKSVSDHTHNRLIQHFNLRTVYTKIQVSILDLPDWIALAKQLPFRGLSVTMPLKEKILPLIDQIDPYAQACSAVNTLLFENGKITGFNTDGIGALNAIEKHTLVKEKKIVILGAGGAARAIAYEALRRGADVTILKRDQMATSIPFEYDFLINCTPAEMPISPEQILPKTYVMDITTKPKETALLMHAREKGCCIIYGYEMFVEQAIGQFRIWFDDKLDVEECRRILTETSLDCLRHGA